MFVCKLRSRQDDVIRQLRRLQENTTDQRWIIEKLREEIQTLQHEVNRDCDQISKCFSNLVNSSKKGKH